jgi:hypothetical protein
MRYLHDCNVDTCTNLYLDQVSPLCTQSGRVFAGGFLEIGDSVFGAVEDVVLDAGDTLD